MKSSSRRVLGWAALIVGLTFSAIGLWLLLSPAYSKATARVSVKHEDTGGPFFKPTQYELFRTDAVLSKVVDGLNLKAEWGKRYAGGRTLETADAMKLLRQHMQVRSDPGTDVIEISVTDQDPDEAAKIVNAIAEAYLFLKQEQQARRASEIEGRKSSDRLPKPDLVQIVDRAVPPKSPNRSRRSVGAILLFGGLAMSALGGIRLRR